MFENNELTENCSLFFIKPEQLKTEKTPKVSCQKCGKRFVMLGNLMRHMKENCRKKKRTLKVLLCNVCNKEVTNLSQHAKKHEKAPIKCSLCPVVKFSHLHMERHTKMRHLETTCPVCNMKLEGGNKPKEHRYNRHRPAKIRKCHHCSKELTTKSGMYAHVKQCIELKKMLTQI